MKTVIALLLLSVLCACEALPPDFGARTFEVVSRTAIAADRDADGVLTSREAKDFGSNPLNWLAIIGTLLGGAGAYGASRAKVAAQLAQHDTEIAHKRIDKAKSEVDELFDRKADKA